ncbi:hypothetical protein A8F94_22215 [Bacillus sp. FJAT-27225]|uniref:hypothetical protein n=1 Tax=Bacillus sp. FJAT-27225 TaxID=1743144 RepID=UPI00080C2CBF|nr:hypothetical protein [Bacillus sp. FJAT-27225]OCA81586.1 hypothetical protein A8F94_22215 [Bacillus sp. FJAT-27225]
MNRTLVLLMMVSIFMMAGCTNESGAASKPQETKQEISKKEIELSRKITELEKQIEAAQKEKEAFTAIINIAKDFVRAHTSGDQESLKFLLSTELSLEEVDNKLYIKSGSEEWLLYSGGDTALENWVLQGFDYQPENDVYIVRIRELYKDKNGNLVSPPTFLNLTFKLENNEWKVSGLNFDV